MIKSKHDAYLYIMKASRPMCLRNDFTDFANEVQQKYNVPIGLTGDIICNRIEEIAATASEEVLFAIIDILPSHISEKNTKKLSDYFSNIEIKKYKKWKYKENKLEFPLVIDCIEVDNDIWVGRADVEWFTLLRNANIIRYNPDIQRTMQRVVKNGREEYVITRNRKAIKGIINRYEQDLYIPNAIVLNISDDSEANFFYDEDNKQLIIKSIKYLDILDGYHRYYGMNITKDTHPDFNTAFILQITNFNIYKGKEYINQQDLKTPMSRIDAASLDVSSPQVQVCERLNDSPLCNWKGQIKRNGGNINLPELSSVIWRYYFSDNKKLTQKDIVDITKEIQEKINVITEQYTEYMDCKICFRELCVLIYFVRNCMNDAKEIKKYLPKLSYVMKETEKDEYKSYWWIHGEHPLKPKVIKFIEGLVK